MVCINSIQILEVAVDEMVLLYFLIVTDCIKDRSVVECRWDYTEIDTGVRVPGRHATHGDARNVKLSTRQQAFIVQ